MYKIWNIKDWKYTLPGGQVLIFAIRLELTLVGGFKDNQGKSEELSLKILGKAHSYLTLLYFFTFLFIKHNNFMKEN